MNPTGKTPYKTLFFLIWLLLPTPFVHGAEGGIEYPEDIASRLQHNYDRIASLSFNFTQNTSGDMAGRPRDGSGSASFLKLADKSYMRWDYSSPDRQVLFSDSVTFSMYFAKLQQMIISPAANLDSDLTYSFFSGRGILKEDFHIRPADIEFQTEGNQGVSAIKLIPKTSQSQVQDIHLWVTKDSLIRRIRICDHFGTITILNLSDIEVDGMVGKDTKELLSFFSFVPPEGTEIIRQ